MTFSRHDFLRIAVAGLPVVTVAPWLFVGAARARPSTEGQYTQAQADRIHNRSTEEAIEQAGAEPQEVKARANQRLHQLRTGSVN